MSNPWLNIPLADYEGHMKSAEVRQLDILAKLFAEALAYSRPISIAILGIAGGNGLDRVDSNITRRIIGLDINPVYLEEARRRYGNRLNLEVHCVDLAQQTVDLEPVQLVHAALVFEHAGVSLCLENALSLVAPGGALSVVLQLPGDSASGIGPSEFSSMQDLKRHFSVIDAGWFQETLVRRGFCLEHQARHSLPAGKGLWMGIFRSAY